jgi:dipeptide/tripeptide permease
MGYPPVAIVLLLHKAFERIVYYGTNQSVRQYLIAILKWSKDHANAFQQGVSALYWGCAILGGYLADEKLGKLKTAMMMGVVLLVGNFFIYMSSAFGVAAMLFIGAIMWAIGGGMMMPAVTGYAGDQVKNNPAGTECFYNVWFMAIQGAVAVYPLMDYMLSRGLFTLFFLVLACTISFAVLLLLLFSWNANHEAPSPTQMIQALRLICCGRDAEFDFSMANDELEKRAKTVKKAYGVFICMFFWGVSANCVQNYFHSQAEMMVSPSWWSANLQLCFDGPPQILIVPMIYFVKKMLAERGYTISHQKVIFSGLLVSVLTFGYSTVLQLFIHSGKKLSVFIQLPIWFFNAYVESTVYAYGLDFAFSVAHPSMKSMILAFFYAAIGIGVLCGGFIFMFFAAYLPFGSGNNAMYQSIVFMAINFTNVILFFCCADWTPIPPKSEDLEEQKSTRHSEDFAALA